MSELMAACGVLCSGCPAYRAQQRGAAHQRRTAAAWRRIYRLREMPSAISCAGCQAPDNEVFHTCRRCRARRCCLRHGFASCAECGTRPCARLEKAQSAWDAVPALADRLTAPDFELYVRPYCGHRERLEAAGRPR
ncbi:MAG TPA: DUF3795 domain-containing protein [Vicinamibacteria bacterium]|nr:DUF3795 domain-containing protein [Vicinamibacteria bacterium]